MRSRLALLVLASAGLTFGVPAAMTGAGAQADGAVLASARPAAVTAVAGFPLGVAIWLSVGLLSLILGAIVAGYSRRPKGSRAPIGALPERTQPDPTSDAPSATGPRSAAA
jgi:hypothetical protein